MSSLTSIEKGLYDAIAGMTVGDGYNFDWGTVNNPDVAQQTFPSAEIVLEIENCLDDKEGVWSSAYELESMFVVRVRTRLDNETTVPTYEINAELNKALQDLKKVFGINYHVSDMCDTVMYVSAQRILDKNNDIFRPAFMDVRFRVRYTEDRTNPDMSAE